MIGKTLGHFLIVDRVGAGGMGEVYRAHDERLGREVAIKVLPASFAADADRLARFEREAKALGALSHPNILSVFEFGHEGQTAYVVTELLEGETLRERLERERLPWRRAVEIAADVAEGLAAAHARGIIHRDLKPENVFLTKGGHVKILDFGLAKHVGAVSEGETLSRAEAVSGDGVLLGTVGYMAPEQVRGERADERSDIFSLGCVLHELLTGRRAFGGGTAVEVLSAILRDPVPEPSRCAPDVPPEVDPVASRCLAKSPDERFQSARDLAFALRSLLSGSFGAVRSPVPVRPRRWGYVVVACALLAAAAAVGWWQWKGKADTAPSGLDPKRVAVAVFENRTGDASLDAVGKMAADWVSDGLSRTGAVEVVPSLSVFDLARLDAKASAHPKSSALALAEETGAGLVVSGAYDLEGQTLRFQATITDAVKKKTLYAVDPASGPKGAPSQAVEALRQQVMGCLAGRFRDSWLEPGTTTKPPTYEAFKEYLAGVELFYADYDKALAHFTRATELDPDFVSPYIWMIPAYMNQGKYPESAKVLEFLDGRRGQLSPLDRCWFEHFQAMLAGNDERSYTAIKDAAKIAPASPIVLYELGYAALAVGRPAEVVETLTRPIRWESLVSPEIPFGSSHCGLLAIALHALGRHEEELETVRQGRKIYPDVLRLAVSEAGALAALGREEELGRLVDFSLGAAPRLGSPSGVMLHAAVELRAHGRRDASIRMANRAAVWFGGLPPDEVAEEADRSVLATCLCYAERWEEARAQSARLVADYPETINYRGMVGVIAAHMGRRQEALRVSEALAKLDRPYLYGQHTYMRACIAAQLGDKEAAVRLLREADAQGFGTWTYLHWDMDLEPLRGYPPFDELAKPKLLTPHSSLPTVPQSPGRW